MNPQAILLLIYDQIARLNASTIQPGLEQLHSRIDSLWINLSNTVRPALSQVQSALAGLQSYITGSLTPYTQDTRQALDNLRFHVSAHLLDRSSLYAHIADVSRATTNAILTPIQLSIAAKLTVLSAAIAATGVQISALQGTLSRSIQTLTFRINRLEYDFSQVTPDTVADRIETEPTLEQKQSLEGIDPQTYIDRNLYYITRATTTPWIDVYLYLRSQAHQIATEPS